MSLAQWVNLSAMAEGVETDKQLGRLREIRYDHVQGYLFRKSIPEDVFKELMKKTDREKAGGREPVNYNNIRGKQTNETK